MFLGLTAATVCPWPGEPSTCGVLGTYAQGLTMKRWITARAVVGAAIPAWMFVISPLTPAVMENAVPDVDDLELPPGTSLVTTEKGCGSGGCWVDVELRPAGGTSEIALLRGSASPTTATCASSAVPRMFWTVCRWRSDRAVHRDRIVVSMAYRQMQ